MDGCVSIRLGGTRRERGTWTPAKRPQYSRCDLQDEMDLTHVGRGDVVSGLQDKQPPPRATTHVNDAYTSEARCRAPGV
jgi:hypothetical protein